MPITCDDIPKQEDVKRWPHLDGIYIPKVEAQVGLLIGNDNPKALEPREIKQSRRKGPFAVRTVFGWTINGPLGRESTGGSHTVNLVKGDIELEEQFKRFCNQEFSDSIADTAMQMSEDDHKAVAIMEQTAVLNGNHYAMALPWKSPPPLLVIFTRDTQKRCLRVCLTALMVWFGTFPTTLFSILTSPIEGRLHVFKS